MSDRVLPRLIYFILSFYIVKDVLEEVFKRKVDLDKILYGKYMHRELKLIESNPVLKDMVWTSSAKRLALMILHSFYFNEPVLLVGETGCGKTRICQTIASVLNRELVIVNCHLNTESSDFLGSLRPCRDLSQEDHKPFQWVCIKFIVAISRDFLYFRFKIFMALFSRNFLTN